MKPVKSVPRYRCEYCTKVLTKYPMEMHEKRCFFNPNRYCDSCQNTGMWVDSDMGYSVRMKCSYCAKCEDVRRDVTRAYEDCLHISSSAERWILSQPSNQGESTEERLTSKQPL